MATPATRQYRFAKGRRNASVNTLLDMKSAELVCILCFGNLSFSHTIKALKDAMSFCANEKHNGQKHHASQRSSTILAKILNDERWSNPLCH